MLREDNGIYRYVYMYYIWWSCLPKQNLQNSGRARVDDGGGRVDHEDHDAACGGAAADKELALKAWEEQTKVM